MKRVFSRALRKSGLVSDRGAAGLLGRVIALGAWGFISLSTLGAAGVDMGPILTTLGITGAGTLGFASKDMAANTMAALALAFQRPFQIGTSVTIASTSTPCTGIVDHWDMRYLYLRGPNNELIHVPNSIIFNSVLIVNDVVATPVEDGEATGTQLRKVKEHAKSAESSTKNWDDILKLLGGHDSCPKKKVQEEKQRGIATDILVDLAKLALTIFLIVALVRLHLLHIPLLLAGYTRDIPR